MKDSIISYLGKILIFLIIVVSNSCLVYGEDSKTISRNEAKKIASNELMQTKYYTMIDSRHPKIYDNSKINSNSKKFDEMLSGFDVLDKDGQSIFNNSWFVLYQESGILRVGNKVLIVIEKKQGRVQYFKFYCPSAILMSTPEGREKMSSFLSNLEAGPR